ncbi:putative integral membrane protein (TIGR02206 family) [Propionicimonas paludicola]|uniref:Putative integral membrane protein (TIGR02206 family) n=1 Tax=Propionicimonas paludicola TaxID=185243 RepID=A0A2A9CUI2_9ACTN|nr:TIGR02206 family membrane protein [Propionicimonas paludicola]PFG17796.1 putative integral membrane protein (TIGR02206 family) [Propionicimonas paludicola]
MGGLTWTWDYFFVPQNRPTPGDAGFGMFSTIHLGVLALIGLGIVALAVGYRRAGQERRRTMRLTIGWTVLSLEVLRQTSYLVNGWYSAEILPLHLCAFATVAVFIDALRPNRWTGDFLYAMGWWGALAANLFPDWATRPILNIFTWQSFSIHGLIFGYLVMRLVGGDLVPDVRNLWRVVVIAAVGCLIGFSANQAFGTNFWFLNAGAPGSPLEPIQKLAGPWYIPVLMVLVSLLWTLLYLPWIIRARRAEAEPAQA